MTGVHNKDNEISLSNSTKYMLKFNRIKRRLLTPLAILTYV